MRDLLVRKGKWFLLLWLLLAGTPWCLLWVGSNWFSLLGPEEMQVAGTIGDALGLANSFFSAAALLLVLESIRLQRQSMEEAQKNAIGQVAEMLKQSRAAERALRMAAVNHTYDLYASGLNSGSDVRPYQKWLLEGLREWAAGSISALLDDESEVALQRGAKADMEEQIAFLRKEDSPFEKVALLVGQLTFHEKLPPTDSARLRNLYAVLRDSSSDVVDVESADREKFKVAKDKFLEDKDSGLLAK